MGRLSENGTAYQIRQAAKQALLEWKEKNGIKAILKKTENQKAEVRRLSKINKKRDAHEARKISHGAASEVRVIDPASLKDKI
jgi:hypothetical protein